MLLHTGKDEKNHVNRKSGKRWPKVLGDCKSADQGVRGRQRGLGKKSLR